MLETIAIVAGKKYKKTNRAYKKYKSSSPLQQNGEGVKQMDVGMCKGTLHTTNPINKTRWNL